MNRLVISGVELAAEGSGYRYSYVFARMMFRSYFDRNLLLSGYTKLEEVGRVLTLSEHLNMPTNNRVSVV